MDAIGLSVFSSRIDAACEEMGAVLRQAAFSTNIKNRLDFSCAVFDPDGRLCAPAAHIPRCPTNGDIQQGAAAIQCPARLWVAMTEATGDGKDA